MSKLGGDLGLLHFLQGIMKVKAPKGYHWMKVGKTFKLMKHTGKFVKHKGASLEANFPIQKVHKK